MLYSWELRREALAWRGKRACACGRPCLLLLLEAAFVHVFQRSKKCYSSIFSCFWRLYAVCLAPSTSSGGAPSRASASVYRGPLPLNPCLYVAPQAISLFRKPLRLIQTSKTRHESPKRVANCYNTHESMSQASILTGAMGCSCCHRPRASRHRTRQGARQDVK